MSHCAPGAQAGLRWRLYRRFCDAFLRHPGHSGTGLRRWATRCALLGTLSATGCAHGSSGAADVEQIVDAGEQVRLVDFLVPDKITVFDFYAQWCEACHTLDGFLADYMRDHPDVALRRINVVDWDSPVAKQYLDDASSLPRVAVYNAAGELVGLHDGFNPSALVALLERSRHEVESEAR